MKDSHKTRIDINFGRDDFHFQKFLGFCRDLSTKEVKEIKLLCIYDGAMLCKIGIKVENDVVD